MSRVSLELRSGRGKWRYTATEDPVHMISCWRYHASRSDQLGCSL